MTNEELIKEKERLEKQVNSGANAFKTIAVLSVINTILIALHTNIWFVMGLGSTAAIQGFIIGLFGRGNNVAVIIGYIIDGLIAILFLNFGKQCKRNKNSAFITGMILYTLDALIFLAIKDYLSIAFHILLLITIFTGYRANNKIKKLPVISDAQVDTIEINNEQIDSVMIPKENRVSWPKGYKGAGIFLTVICLGFAIGAIFIHEVLLTLCFVIFAALGVIPVLFEGEAFINDSGFKIKIKLGTYFIPWHEIEFVHVAGTNMVVGGNDKKLTFINPQYWTGSEGERVREIFLSKLKDRNISIENTRKASFSVVKNCKVAE